MIGLPPLLLGALKYKTALVGPGEDDQITGGFGTDIAGVMLFDGVDAGPVPTALVAVMVKVYGVPLVRPVTLINAQGAVHAPVKFPGLEVAV